jgi:uncharacterized protein involved in exopolysaccharide biosynthesis/Mrp family chromosome partitioning ATPase
MVKNRTNGRVSEGSLQDISYVLLRHKRRVVTFSVVFFVIVALGTFLMPAVYRSDAKVLVGLGRENVTLDPTATTGRVVDVERSRQSEINSEIEILKSRDLAGMVVDSIGAGVLMQQDDMTDRTSPSSNQTVLDEIRSIKRKLSAVVEGPSEASRPKNISSTLRERDEAIHTLMQNLMISGSKESNVISISYEAHNPKLAQEVINKLIQLYLDKHINVHRTVGSYEFFIQQTERLRNALSQTARDLRDLKNKTGTVSVEEQRRIILNWIAALQQEMEQTDASVAASRAKVGMMRERLAALPETLIKEKVSGFPNQAADRMRERLYELQLKEQDLLSKFTENSLPVQEIRRQIQEAKALLLKEERTRTQVTQGVNTSFQQLQFALLTEDATLSSLEAKAQVLREQHSRAQGELRDLNDNEVHVTQLQREMNIQEELYRKNAESLEQARIGHALEKDKISNINVVEPATYPVKPIRPSKRLNLALGFFLGILGGIALAFITEYADHSIKTSEDVATKLQLQTLATVPFAAPHEVPAVGEKRPEETPSPAGDEGTGPWEAQFLARREREAAPELAAKVGSWEAQFRASRKEEEPRVAPLGNAGKETVAKWEMPLETREIYGTLRDRLLLAAGDSLEVPYIFGLTSCQTGEGVSSIATNLAIALAQQYAHGGVLLINASTDAKFEGDGYLLEAYPLCGPKKMALDLQEMYEPQELAKLMPLLKENYRFVVFDLPAIRQTSSAVKLAAMVDGVVLVVEAEGVRWEEAKQTTDLLVQGRANLLGAVLNKTRFYVPEWLSRRM